MSCKDKLSNICTGKKTNAKCVKLVDIVLPDFSELEEECLNQNDATQEIYNKLDEIQKALDTSNVENFCIEFEANDGGNITQKEINEGILKFICEKHGDDNSEEDGGGNGDNSGGKVKLSEIDYSECNFDFKDLTSECSEEFDNLCVILQTLINQASKVKSLEEQVNTLTNTVDNFNSTLTTLVAEVEILKTQI